MVPNGWKENSIKTVCSSIIDCVNKTAPVTDGITPYRMIRTTNVRDGRLSLDSVRYVSAETYKTWIRRGAPLKNDIILTREAPVGEVGLVEEDDGIFLGQRLMMYRADPQKADYRFILYSLLGSFCQRQLEVLSNGGTVHHVRVPECEKIKILVPPLPEQKKIARILSTWDKAIETVDKLIENSQQQKKALMQQLLTGKKRLPGFSGEWEKVRLGKVAQINPKKSAKPSGGLVSFIPMDAVSESAQIIYLATRNYDDVSKGFSAFAEDYVLVAKITPCFENGKGAQATGLVNGVGFGTTEFHVIRGKQELHPRFIYYITNSYEFRFRGEANMQGSAGQRRVPTDFIKAYQIDLPPLEEQEAICTVLDANTSILQALHDQKAFATHEKQALMQQLLTGKRRVNINDIDEATA